MTRDVLIGVVAGILELVALAYFAAIALNANRFAQVLLHRGWDKRGWTEDRLAMRLRIIGVLGAIIAAVAIVLALMRALGLGR